MAAGKKAAAKKGASKTEAQVKKSSKKAAVPESRLGKVVEIEVAGAKNVNPSIVLLSLTMKAGSDLTEALIDENMKRVFNIGYFTQDIGVDVLSVKDGKKVIFKVVENPLIKSIKIKGNTLVDNDKILKAMQNKAGQVFNSALVSTDVQSVQKIFDEAGYTINNVYNVQFDGEVLTLFVQENIIESIKVVGNDKTKDYVILRELKFKTGEVYDDKKITRSLQKIQNLGFFSEIRPRCEPGTAPGKVDFIVEVKEQKTGTITIGGGYSSANGFVGIFEIAQKNWRGKGQTLNARLEFGGTRTYEFGFVEPWFRNKRLSLGGNVYNTRTTQKFYQPNKPVTDYTESRKGFNLSLGKPFSEIVEGSLTFRDENVSLTDANSIQNVLNQNYIREGHYQTLSAYLGRDTRDNVFNPRRGTFNAVNLDSTGGFLIGPDSFSKQRLTLRKYQAVNSRGVIAGRLTGGTINLTSGTLPLYEEYGVGGVYTIRGYEWREFIGKKMMVGNVEYRHKLHKNFEGYLFYDFGDAWDSDSLLSTNTKSEYKLKKGYGVGFNFITPIGPIRIDYGKGEDRTGKAYFSMDRMF
jgi:outer membrane protein insertion porin family